MSVCMCIHTYYTHVPIYYTYNNEDCSKNNASCLDVGLQHQRRMLMLWQ